MRVPARPQTRKEFDAQSSLFRKLQRENFTAEDVRRGHKPLRQRPQVGKRTKHAGTKAVPTKS